jgi:hypothetical protein
MVLKDILSVTWPVIYGVVEERLIVRASQYAG